MKPLRSVVLALAAAALVSAAVPTPDEEKDVMAAIDAWINATVTQAAPGGGQAPAALAAR